MNRRPDSSASWIGVWTHWHDNGQKSSEITYKAGKLDGLFTKWDEQGNVMQTLTYKNDALVK